MAKEILDTSGLKISDSGENLGLLEFATPDSARRAQARAVASLGEGGETPILDSLVVSARPIA